MCACIFFVHACVCARLRERTCVHCRPVSVRVFLSPLSVFVAGVSVNPPRHCLLLSIAGASVSVTMFLSTYLCCGCLSHPITISRLYRGRLYHPVTVTLSLLRVHLSSRHRLPISIAGPFVNLPLTLSLSRCLYHSNLCHLVIITMCLVPCSCHHTTIDRSW